MKPVKRPPEDLRVREESAQGLSDSYLLEAGAGTGKTTVLLDRVERILTTNVPLERIAVITFTEKAAGELKLKLRRRIEAMLQEFEHGTGWTAHLRRSLESLDRASVGTIHSFAASLLRERPVEAAVDPRFTVADPLAASMLMAQTWQRWIERETSVDSPEPTPLARALRLGVTLEQIRALAFEMVEKRDVLPGPWPSTGGSSLERLRQAREKILDGALQLSSLASSCGVETDRGLKQIRKLQERLPGLRAAEGDRLLAALEALPLASNAGAKGNWFPSSVLDRVKTLMARLDAARREASLETRAELAQDLALWVRHGFLHEYRTAKESRRLLDFADLLILCRRMLRDSRAAREDLQGRFDCLLVDEFQDTDPIQAEIIFLLAAQDPEATDWRLSLPRKGKLFVVGDPKQSIYRFRRADIGMYQEAKRLIGASGGVTDRVLTQSFRAAPSIVSWVNDLFSGLMRQRYSSIAAYRPEPEAGRSRGAPGPIGVTLLTPAGPAGLSAADVAQVRLTEARHVVALIKKGVREEWPVVGRDGADPRSLTYGDIALLFRASTAMETYEEILRANQVPYRIAGGKRYYMRAEIQALRAVLRAVQSPHDPLAVVSALRSPFFGYSDQELLSYAAAGGDWVYARTGAGRGTPFERAFDLLARLHAGRGARSIASTLEEIFEATGALALFYLKPDGDQRAANLLKAIDLARAHETAGGIGFGSFVRWLERMSEEEREEAEAPLSEELEAVGAQEGPEPRADAVKVLTVHKAKGLEFPMVVLCDPAGGPQERSPRCLIKTEEREARMEVCCGTVRNQLASAGYAEAWEEEKDRLKEESLRLFYVAATRARDYLVIPAFGGKRPKGIHAVLQEAGFLPAHSSSQHRGAEVIDGSSLEIPSKAAEPFRIPLGAAAAPDPSLIVEKAGWRKALDLALAAPAMGREFRTASGMEAEPAEPARPIVVARRDAARRRARAVGDAVHSVLERIDLATGRDIGLLSEEEATRVGHPDLAEEIRALAGNALRSRVVKEALASPRCFRELPFAAAGDAYLTEGRLDLVFEAGGGLTIVDFKTDHVTSPGEIDARMSAYEPQAMIYARSLSQIARLPVRQVVFFFVRPGVERSIPVDEAFLARGRRLLETGAR